MAKTINILTLVDVDTTRNNNGSVRALMLDDNGGTWRYGTQTDELNTPAAIGDSIRWYIKSMQPGYSIAITKFTFYYTNPNVHVFGGRGQVASPTVVDNVWQVGVHDKGQVTYQIQFYVYDVEGIKYGPFSWDPFVTVS